MFERKIKLVLSQDEYCLIIRSLTEFKNKLLAENRYTNAVDELLIKICK